MTGRKIIQWVWTTAFSFKVVGQSERDPFAYIKVKSPSGFTHQVFHTILKRNKKKNYGIF